MVFTGRQIMNIHFKICTGIFYIFNTFYINKLYFIFFFFAFYPIIYIISEKCAEEEKVKCRDTDWCLLKERVNQVNSSDFQTWLYEYKETTVFSENKSRYIIITYEQFLYKYVVK